MANVKGRSQQKTNNKTLSPTSPNNPSKKTTIITIISNPSKKQYNSKLAFIMDLQLEIYLMVVENLLIVMEQL